MTWTILSTPPMSGVENMAYDLKTLSQVQSGKHPPTFRLFRWSEPTVSYGRHQHLESIQAQIPRDVKTVQRPTGGGVVLHGNDLCLSLCWTLGQSPIPERLSDVYAWIHAVVMHALPEREDLRLATCNDCATTPEPFATRDCFTQPVGFDILLGEKKIVGGALCRQKDAFLYQGSIQGANAPELADTLTDVFSRALSV